MLFLYCGLLFLMTISPILSYTAISPLQNHLDVYKSSTTSLSATVKETLLKDPRFSIFASMIPAVADINAAIGDPKVGAGFNFLTVLAPSNEAFQKLDNGILKKLASVDNLAILRKMIRFHFIEDILTSEEIYQRPSIDTLALISVSIKPQYGGMLGTGPVTGFKIAEAKITRPDISCENGIIHEVDTLVSPFILFRYLVAKTGGFGGG